MLSPWDAQTAPLTNGTNIYDFSFRNETGLNANSPWTASQLAHIDGEQNQYGVSPNFQYVRPDASQQASAASINNYLTNEGTARQVFGMTPGSQGSAGGVPLNMGGGAPATGTGTSSGMAGTSSGFGPSSLGLSGGTGATGTAGAGVGMGGATSGATAGSGGFWGMAKAALGNKALLSGLVSGLGAAYGQYSQKKQAKDNYKWQQGQLNDQRRYQEEQYQRRQNSPQAQMARGLMAALLPEYIAKIKKRHPGGNFGALDQLLASMGGMNG